MLQLWTPLAQKCSCGRVSLCPQLSLTPCLDVTVVRCALQASMNSGTEGPYRLAAVLEGFKLLNTALQYDMGAAEAINTMTVRERVSPLHVQLVNPPRRLAVLLQYVLYNNMDLQYEVSVSFSFNVPLLSLTNKLRSREPRTALVHGAPRPSLRVPAAYP